jgi:hypothetical protein
MDQWGHRWAQTVTLYYQRLTKEEQQWWITKKPPNSPYPEEVRTGMKSFD